MRDISTETQAARGELEDKQFNADVERATVQQANSSKQRQAKTTYFSRIPGGNRTRRFFKYDVRLFRQKT